MPDTKISALPAGVPLSSDEIPVNQGGVPRKLGAGALVTALGVTVLHRNLSTVEVTNSSAEGTLYTFTIPGGTLGPNRVVELQLGGTYLNNSGATKTLTLRYKYGATTLYQDVTATIAASASLRAFWCELLLGNTGVTNSQKLSARFHIAAAGAVTTGVGDIGAVSSVLFGPMYGTSAVDSTLNQALTVTVQHSVANANTTISAQVAVLKLL